MKAAVAVFTLILVLLPVSILIPLINNDDTDLTDSYPRNFNVPWKGDPPYANSKDKSGLLALDNDQLAEEGDPAPGYGSVSPGDTITIKGRLFGWADGDFYTLAEVSIYIFWNTNVTVPDPWVNSPPYNGLTIDSGTTHIASVQTNGTATPGSGGEVDTAITPYTEAGYFEATFQVPALDDSQYNVQVGNNSILAYFMGSQYHYWHVHAGHTWVDLIGAAELGETAADASVSPGGSATFDYRVTLEGTTTAVSNASVRFNFQGTAPFGTTISSTYASSGGNIWRTDSNGYISFQVDTEIETPFGAHTLNATIVELDPDDIYSISSTNNQSTPILTVQNLFADAIVEVTAQPTPIQAGFFTIVTVETKFQGNGTAIGGVPVNITVTPSVGSLVEHFNDSYIINPGNHLSPKPGWYLTNSSGLISWNYTTFYYEFGNYSIEGPTSVSRGNVQVDAIADYGHWAYDKVTQPTDYQRFYFMNGTNNQDWANQFDNSTDTTLVNIDNQWEFGILQVQSIDQDNKIEAGDDWRHLRADSFARENLSLVLRVYNYNTSASLPNVNVTFWLNASTGLRLWFWNTTTPGWQDVTSAITSGTTAETDVNGELHIRINVTATATKYEKVVLHAYANFTQFPRFKYLNGTKKVGTERISNITDTLGTPDPWDRGFQINPRYKTGTIILAAVGRYSDNDTYALGYSGISTTDGTIRRGNWVNIKYQVFNGSQALGNAPVNFTHPDGAAGIALSVDTGKYPSNGSIDWYLTDSSGFIEVNVSTDYKTSPKILANLNVTGTVSFTAFPYINASLTEQTTAVNGTFTLDPQYVYGSVDATIPTPRKVPSGGSDILITFNVRDFAGGLVPGAGIANWSASGAIFALYNGTAGNNSIADHTKIGFTITFTGVTDLPDGRPGYNGSINTGAVTFTIDPTPATTPEGDYYLMITANYTDCYDAQEYLNGTTNNCINATSLMFTIREKITVSVGVDGTNPSLGQADGLYLVKRGVTQIAISGTVLDSLGNPKTGVVSIGWNATKRTDGLDRIEWNQNVTVAAGAFSAQIIITTASNMPLDNITIFADNTTRTNEEFNPSVESEIITYAQIRLVSDIFFASGPNTDRPLVYIGQSCTISGTLVDDTGAALNDTISPATLQIRGHNGGTYESGTEVNPALSSGAFSGTFDVPDNYAQDAITIVVNVTETAHYNYTSSQSLILRVYSDVNQGSSQGTVDGNLHYDNTSTYTALTGGSGNIAHNEVVEIYYGNVDVSGYLYDQVNDPMNESGANQVAVLWVVNGTTSWWQNTTTNSVGRFLVSFNNSDWNWALLTNDSWTIIFYFKTDNGTLLWFQNITIDYHILDFAAPTQITTMEQSGTSVANGTVVYGTVTLYVNATDPGPSAGVAKSGIASDALTYSINNGPVQQATYNTTHWAITIDADSSAYDVTDSHTIFINITDKHDNLLQYTWVFLVDNTAPNVTAGQADGVLLVGLVTLTFSLAENATVTGYTALEASTILYDTDNSGSPQSGTANFTDPTLTLALNATALSGENHTIQVWVNDTAGNQGTLLFRFTIDDNAPLVENWGTQVNGSKLYRGNYTISLTLSDPSPGSGINNATISVYVDAPANSLTTPVYNPSTNYYESTWDTTGYALGMHTLTVLVSDVHGNQRSSILRLGIVEISSPEAQGTSPNLNWTGYLGTTAGEAVNIRVEDPSSAGSLDITIVSWTPPAAMVGTQLGNISITLSETSAGSGIFIGQLFFSLQSSSASANQIEVTTGGQVIITLSELVGDPGAYVATWYGGTTGAIERDKSVYQNGETAIITVTDSDANLDSNAIDTLSGVNVFSDSDAIGVRVTLQETSANSGVFEGQIKFVTGETLVTSDPRELKIRNDDTITFRYSDLADDNGEPARVEVTATAIVESQGGGGGVLNLILLIIAAPVALGGGIGAAVLFERFRENFLAK
ncbi:MAG: hypothetical protein ACFFGZ_07090 [Candidatus Thorarchaeota archaeon]